MCVFSYIHEITNINLPLIDRLFLTKLHPHYPDCAILDLNNVRSNPWTEFLHEIFSDDGYTSRMLNNSIQHAKIMIKFLNFACQICIFTCDIFELKIFCLENWFVVFKRILYPVLDFRSVVKTLVDISSLQISPGTLWWLHAIHIKFLENVPIFSFTILLEWKHCITQN